MSTAARRPRPPKSILFWAPARPTDVNDGDRGRGRDRRPRKRDTVCRPNCCSIWNSVSWNLIRRRWGGKFLTPTWRRLVRFAWKADPIWPTRVPCKGTVTRGDCKSVVTLSGHLDINFYSRHVSSAHSTALPMVNSQHSGPVSSPAAFNNSPNGRRGHLPPPPPQPATSFPQQQIRTASMYSPSMPPYPAR